MIEGMDYKFHGFSLKPNLNVILCSVHQNNQNNPNGFLFKIYDLNSIELVSLGEGKLDYRIFAPAKTIEDYQHKINNLRIKYKIK